MDDTENQPISRYVGTSIILYTIKTTTSRTAYNGNNPSEIFYSGTVKYVSYGYTYKSYHSDGVYLDASHYTTSDGLMRKLLP